MSLEDDFKEKLKDADFKYFDSLVKEAIHDHRKSFSFSRQHFETMHDAQETMREWQFSRDVIAHIDIDPIEITVHLRTESQRPYDSEQTCSYQLSKHIQLQKSNHQDHGA